MNRSTFVAAQVILVFAAPPLLAQPVISGVSPTGLTHGRTGVVISGSNFGTKSAAAPVIYDTFENGSISPAWQTFRNGPYTIVSDNNRHSHSTRTLKANFADDTMHIFVFGEGVGYVGKWYTRYYFKYASNVNWNDQNFANIKVWRASPDPWDADHFVNLYWNWRPDTDENYIGCEGGVDSLYPDFKPRRDVTLDVWHCIEVQYAENSAPGAANGHITIWFDDRNIESSSHLTTATTAHPNRAKYLMVAAGMHCGWGPASQTTYFWLDDIYVDKSWARVMIGNASTWNACTHREVQIPTAWSSTSVTITVNQGVFAYGTQAYFYVVDAGGNVNANGFPITLGGEQPISDLTPPFVSGQSPAPDAQNVPVNSNVVLHVQDSGDGVDVSSIAVKVNGATVTPQTTGTSSDYTVTYDPPSDFAYNATVTVTVNARDLHTPPNVMNQVSYSFKTIAGDTASPFVSGQDPAPNAQNEPVDTNVVLHVQDSGDGVDKASIVLTVNGAAVTPLITGTSSDYTVTYDPPSDFAYNATVTVTVNARDLHTPPNVMNQVSYSFKTIAGDTASPFVSGQDPAPNAQNEPVDTNVVLHVQDSGAGVDVNSIRMRVNGSSVTPQITGTAADYTLTYNPLQDFSFGQTVTVTVDASDLAGNAMPPATYTFTTKQEEDPSAQDDPAATDPNVFFYDDFEGGDFSRWDGTSHLNTSTGKATIVSDAVPGSTGQRVAQFTTFDAGGGTALVDTRKNFPPGYDTVYARWYAKFDSDFDGGSFFHFCGLIGGADNWRSDFKPDGTDAFSSFLDPWDDWGRNPPPGELMFYTYYPDMTQDPDGHWWGNSFAPDPPFQLERGRWYCMEMMIKTNTPGRKDGEQAFWIDGHEIGHWYGMRWRDVNSLKIDFFWLESYVPGSSNANTVWFDNVALSTAYIGPFVRPAGAPGMPIGAQKEAYDRGEVEAKEVHDFPVSE